VTKSDLRSAVGDLHEQLVTFSRHVYDVRNQHAELRHLKDTLKPGVIIVQEGFAENYSIKHQKEIMSAHWSAEGVTIFTIVVFFRETGSEELKHLSVAIVADEMVHGKKSVYAFNSKLMDHLKTVLPWPVTHVHYRSDGAASQFKNHYTFANLVFHKKDFDCTADWSYFCTAHGKGPVDGVGGHVKRSGKSRIAGESHRDFSR